MNKGINKKVACIFLVFILCGVDHAIAALSSADIKTTKIQVALNKSKLITLHSNIEEISQGNPAIADFPMDMEAAESTFMPPNQVMIRGKSLGTTNLYLWGAKGKIIQVLDIEVTHDLATLKAKLNELLPDEVEPECLYRFKMNVRLSGDKNKVPDCEHNIKVRSSQKNIVLSGEVTTLANMQAAFQLARTFLGPSSTLNQGGNSTALGAGSTSMSSNYAPPKIDPNGSSSDVINLMSVGGAQQVMLDVKVAEINRTVLKGLNVHFSALQVSNAFDGFSVAKLGGGMAGAVTGIQSLNSFSASNVFLSMISGQFLLNLTIDAANEQGLAKILAQPTLTTLSGQAATFLSGGEFPIPVPQASGGNGAITIQFKQYGIGLKFVPIVLDSGRINMNMNISVSELSQDAAVVAQAGTSTSSYSIPSLTKREASSTLELADGQTMSIAGLISEKMKESINKFPGLGDIPGLGVLFKDSKFAKNTTELVIFVTPRLAKPVLAQNALLPTDSFVEPDNVDFFVLGRTESRKVRNRWVDKDVATRGNNGGLDGDYGQQLVVGGQ